MTTLYCHNDRHGTPCPHEPGKSCLACLDECDIVELRNLDGSRPSAEALLEFAIPLMVRLGDFIGNARRDFGRCSVILAARELLEEAKRLNSGTAVSVEKASPPIKLPADWRCPDCRSKQYTVDAQSHAVTCSNGHVSH